MGARQYLTKPLTVNQLQETIFSLEKKVHKKTPDHDRALFEMSAGSLQPSWQ